MIAALRHLGADIPPSPAPSGGGVERSETEGVRPPLSLKIHGVAGRWHPRLPEGSANLTLHLGNAGTATRFLAAASLRSPIPITIDGDEHMRRRPIAGLVTHLRALGAQVEHLASPTAPPIRISPPDRLTTNALEIPPTASSQFISALLLVAPWLEGGLTLRLLPPITSASYVRMTLSLLERLEVEVQASDDLSVVRVPHGPPHAFEMDIEPDASGATYFWAAGALLPGASVRVEGLGAESLQGDAAFPDLLARMGARVREQRNTPSAPPSTSVAAPTDTLRPIMCDMGDMPDAAMTLAAVASFAPAPSIIRGVRTLRVKETDRIAALVNELAKVGVRVDADVQADPDTITITPPPGGIDCSPDAPPVVFETYDDHRMAMSLALIGLRRPNVSISNPACVAKTYPGFWRDLAGLYL
ncbi:MAG: 3-phosphoshikimate 1-carboxyvinyltransferase [Phycisphaerales bacterium]